MQRKYAFTNYMRGIATLLVLFAHWGVAFLNRNEVSAELGYFNPISWIDIPLISKVGYAIQRYVGLNPGVMGVALFFLISGFLIKSSLKNRTWLKFILTRILRIYPLYIICLFITCIILKFSSSINDIPLRINLYSFLANASLMRSWFGISVIDGVVWTLEVEMFFYIIACIISYYDRAIFEIKIIAAMDLLSVVYIYVIHGFYEGLSEKYLYLYNILFTLGHYLVYIPFILLGAICRLRCDNGTNKKRFFCLLFVQLAVFIINVYYFYPMKFSEYIPSYFLMTTIFVISMKVKIEQNIIGNIIKRFLEGVARISFPFYALHGAAGYAVLAFLYYRLKNLMLTYIISLVLFVLCSYLVHITVERFTRKLQGIVDD